MAAPPVVGAVTDVTCVRCGATAPGLPRAPLPGPLGAGILARVCAACWSAWMARSLIVVNEHRLDLFSDEGARVFEAALCEFLNLAPDGGPGPRPPGAAGSPPPAGYVPPGRVC